MESELPATQLELEDDAEQEDSITKDEENYEKYEIGAEEFKLMGNALDEALVEQRKRLELLHLREKELNILKQLRERRQELSSIRLLPLYSKETSNQTNRSVENQPSKSIRKLQRQHKLPGVQDNTMRQSLPIIQLKSNRHYIQDKLTRRSLPNKLENAGKEAIEVIDNSPKSVDDSSQRLMNVDENWKGIRIKVYRNGDPYYNGAVFAINRHICRTWGYLLKCLTSTLPVKHAVRSIYTLSDGQRVTTLNQLKHEGEYVAVSQNEHLQLIRYPGAKGQKQQEQNVEIQEADIKPEVMSKLKVLEPILTTRKSAVPNDRKTENEPQANTERKDGIHINLFRNGDHINPCSSIFVPQNNLNDMTSLLQTINQQLGLVFPNSPIVQKIFNINGEGVHATQELQNHQQYVVASGHEIFLALPYGQSTPRLTISRVHYHKASEPLRYLDAPLTPPSPARPSSRSKRRKNRWRRRGENKKQQDDSAPDQLALLRDKTSQTHFEEDKFMLLNKDSPRMSFEQTEYQFTTILCVGAEPDVCLANLSSKCLSSVLATNPRATDQLAVSVREFICKEGGFWIERRLRVAHELGCTPSTVDLHVVGDNLLLLHAQHPHELMSALCLVHLHDGRADKPIKLPLYLNYCVYDRTICMLWGCPQGKRGELKRWKMPGVVGQTESLRLPQISDEIMELRCSLHHLALWTGRQVHVLRRQDWTEILLLDNVDSSNSFAFDMTGRLFIQLSSGRQSEISVWQGEDEMQLVCQSTLPTLVRGGRRKLRFHQDPVSETCFVREQHDGWLNVIYSSDLLAQRLQKSEDLYEMRTSANNVDWRRFTNQTVSLSELK